MGRLRRRAEDALEGRRHTEAETLLDRLLEMAEGEDALFAHRQLAQLRLERHPWRAALHLRHVLKYTQHDDVPHAMMGLCQALLGNYRAAVSSYRRALQEAPGTPWYLHNLGHLLDVALDQPKVALAPLEEAFRLEPTHDEIAASLGHCVARLGDLERALQLAKQATDYAPQNRDHRRLLKWVQNGAPPEGMSDPAEPTAGLDTKVRESFEKHMASAGFTHAQVDHARDLWRDFTERRVVRTRKPAVLAAAIEYAIAVIHRRRGVTQAKIARRYGVAAGSLSSRYGEIRDALALRPNDPRYAG